MGLPTTANYIVMASLTAPIIMELSANNGYLIPIIAAHMFVFYFGILAERQFSTRNAEVIFSHYL
jgi:TRAP-type uncharacterized transport system fused permease subunit